METSDLKLFRKRRKLTQEDAALMFGCTQSFISQIEKGVCPIPSDIISKILDMEGRSKVESEASELIQIIKHLNSVIVEKDARITELTNMLIMGFTQGGMSDSHLGKGTKAG